MDIFRYCTTDMVGHKSGGPVNDLFSDGMMIIPVHMNRRYENILYRVDVLRRIHSVGVRLDPMQDIEVYEALCGDSFV